ncbi:hypothetical protein HY440_00205 [Candidatus Microgenomates bacterium]|nr:hypothetical protein [Candidatus Microgenomates bacterium]
MNKLRFGVIDVGTLKVKLQIVEVGSTGKLKTIYASSEMTFLGHQVDQNGGRPRPENLKKTIVELARCKKVMDKEAVSKVRAVSTHALREMGAVGREIAAKIKKETGLTVEIISAQEEAELFYKAVLADFKTNKDFTIVDVGGGSVQVLIGNKKKLKKSFLFKSGTITLWDKFTPKHTGMDAPNREEIRMMKDYILAQLQPVPGKIKTPIIYGSSCVIDLFKGIRVKMKPFSGSLSHPYKTDLTDLEKFLDQVWAVPYDVREERYVSPTPQYMWGIDRAFLNVVELAKKVGAPYVIPSNANINQGLILSML